MSEDSMEQDDLLIQIRDKLRKNEIKLWLSPYYSEINGPSELDILSLSSTITESLHLPLERCTEIIKQLQANSLENLKQKNRFEESGLATLKIKIVDKGKSPKTLLKEVMLSCRGCDLKEYICQDISCSPERLKIISAGKVLDNASSLSSQGVKNGQQILVITLSATPEEVGKNENDIKQLETVKTDSQLLALDNQYIQLEDQFGNPIKISNTERKALIVAMTLHEKGRTALKREDYSAALVFLLEADQEFRNCCCALLKTVDNYALLDLDISWCYLCLQSFTHLPEAEERLKRCEEKLLKTYGLNMERVVAVKGTTGSEACLMVRLHLLQAIVFYHKNERAECLALLRKVEGEVQTLKVDEESIMVLVELGYSTAEARLGLRATGGDTNRAAEYISEYRQKRVEARQKALAEEILNKERKKLGKCIDGKQYVDPNFVKMLVNMGFNMEAAKVALKQCNNIISDSIQYIKDNPSAGPSHSKSFEFNRLLEELVPELVDAGFDPRMARLALQKHDGDLAKAAEELLANDGIVLGDMSLLDVSPGSIEEIKRKKPRRNNSTTDKEKKKKKDEAFERLKEDISVVDDDHLDINLFQEEVFLRQYLSLVDK